MPLPNGISVNDILLHLGLPVQTESTMPEVYAYVERLTYSAIDVIENLTGIDIIGRPYQTSVLVNKQPVFLKPYVNPATFLVKDSENNTIPSSAYSLNATFGMVEFNAYYGQSVTIHWETLTMNPVPDGLRALIMAMVSYMYNTRTTMPQLTPEQKKFINCYRNPRVMI